MSIALPADWALSAKGGGGENASVGGLWKAAVPFEGGATMVSDAEDKLEACQTARFDSDASVPVAVILDGLRDASVDSSRCTSADTLCAVVGGLGPGGGDV